jgi:hypothetical protein
MGPGVTMTLVDQIGGEVTAVAARGDYAYVGIGPRLVVLDVRDPTQPRKVGETEPLPVGREGEIVYGCTITQIELVGEYAYLCVDVHLDARGSDQAIYLFQVDVSYPEAPATQWGTSVAQGVAFTLHARMAVDDDTLWLAYEVPYYDIGASGTVLHLRRISEADTRDGIGTRCPTTAQVIDITLSDMVVFDGRPIVAYQDWWSVFGSPSLLDLFSATQECTLDRVGRLGLSTPSPRRAFVRNAHFLLLSDQQLDVIDLSDATQPTVVSSCALWGVGGAGDAAVTDDGFYLIYATDTGLSTVDITEPRSPRQVSHTALAVGRQIVVAGQRAYLATGRSLVILDASIPSSLHVLGTYTPPPVLRPQMSPALGSDKALAYVDSALYTLDMSNPESPTVLGSCSVGGNITAANIQGRYGWLTTGETSLTLVDMSSLDVPARAGVCDIGVPFQLHEVHEGYGYLTSDSFGLVIVNAVDPHLPTVIYRESPQGNMSPISAVRRVGNDLYWTTEDGWLNHAIMSEESGPGSVERWRAPDGLELSRMVGHHALVTRVDREEGEWLPRWVGAIEAYDLSVVGQPPHVASVFLLPSPVESLAIHGNSVYVMDAKQPEYLDDCGVSVRLIDYVDPLVPSLVGLLNVADHRGYSQAAFVPASLGISIDGVYAVIQGQPWGFGNHSRPGAWEAYVLLLDNASPPALVGTVASQLPPSQMGVHTWFMSDDGRNWRIDVLPGTYTVLEAEISMTTWGANSSVGATAVSSDDASACSYLALGPGSSAYLPLNASHPGRHTLWVRGRGLAHSEVILFLDSPATCRYPVPLIHLGTDSDDEWVWYPLDVDNIDAYYELVVVNTLPASASAPPVALDCFILTDDPDFVPTGVPRPCVEESFLWLPLVLK